eukprot:snap_masked-scaffold_74-processed-gene-0.53-mRNA-1 protein AED:1.00 eAED:1.00 QI:0/0/0/0/1/1/2/0/332
MNLGPYSPFYVFCPFIEIGEMGVKNSEISKRFYGVIAALLVSIVFRFIAFHLNLYEKNEIRRPFCDFRGQGNCRPCVDHGVCEKGKLIACNPGYVKFGEESCKNDDLFKYRLDLLSISLERVLVDLAAENLCKRKAFLYNIGFHSRLPSFFNEQEVFNFVFIRQKLKSQPAVNKLYSSLSKDTFFQDFDLLLKTKKSKSFHIQDSHFDQVRNISLFQNEVSVLCLLELRFFERPLYWVSIGVLLRIIYVALFKIANKVLKRIEVFLHTSKVSVSEDELVSRFFTSNRRVNTIIRNNLVDGKLRNVHRHLKFMKNYRYMVDEVDEQVVYTYIA